MVSSTDNATLTHDIIAELADLSDSQRRTMAERWATSALRIHHLQALMLLEEGGPLMMSRLASALGLSVSNATGIVRRMEQRELVERVRLGSDRRHMVVRLTAVGRTLVESMETAHRQQLAGILRGMGRERQENLLRGLRDLRAAIESLEGMDGTDRSEGLDGTDRSEGLDGTDRSEGLDGTDRSEGLDGGPPAGSGAPPLHRRRRARMGACPPA